MAHGKNINVFLMDNNPTGRIKCTIANWTGVAYKIPRTELEKCKDRDDLKQSGVYFLFGISDETGKHVAYIGQAGNRKNGEGILNRLLEHKKNPDKDYWKEAVMFTTSNNSFGPTEISFLENKFCNMAIKAQRYEVKNGNEPTPGNITEEKESELEEFTEYARIIMGVLGHNVFEPFTNQKSSISENDLTDKKESTTFHLQRKIKALNLLIEATGKQTTEGFVVLKGSIVSPEEDGTISNVISEIRKNAKISNDHILQEDILFSSPSGAAMFVVGKAANGLTSWKTSDGITLKSFEIPMDDS